MARPLSKRQLLLEDIRVVRARIAYYKWCLSPRKGFDWNKEVQEIDDQIAALQKRREELVAAKDRAPDVIREDEGRLRKLVAKLKKSKLSPKVEKLIRLKKRMAKLDVPPELLKELSEELDIDYTTSVSKENF